MKKPVLVVTTCAFVLAVGVMAASAQESPSTPMIQQQDQQHTQHHPADRDGSGMMGQGGMMGRGTREGGMMGQGMMQHQGMMGPFIMRMIFALMDSDSDGTVSLQEFQVAHERMFKAMDANKDGRLTLDEMRAFMQGTSRSGQQE